MNPGHAVMVKSNRQLGSVLVERGLIEHRHLEAASERLIDAMQNPGKLTASILSILIFELQKLEESALIAYLVEEENLGALPLGSTEFDPSAWPDFAAGLAGASRTIPVDRKDGFITVATSYYLSPPAREYWESELSEHIIWTVAPLLQIEKRIESLIDAQSQANTSASGVERSMPIRNT